jgi:hypothetical protein
MKEERRRERGMRFWLGHIQPVGGGGPGGAVVEFVEFPPSLADTGRQLQASTTRSTAKKVIERMMC